MDYAELVYLPNPLTPKDNEPQAWEWVWKGDYKTAFVNYRSLSYAKSTLPKEGAVIRMGAYRVRVIEVDSMRQGFHCIRENWWGIPRLYSRRLARFTGDTWQRILWTMEIWGLAEQGVHALTWRDIKLVKWLMNRVRK